MPSSILLLFDKPWISYLVSGKPPLAAYSHDQMLFQLGHESLRKGLLVYLQSAHETQGAGDTWRVTQFFPVLEMEIITAAEAAKLKPTFVALAYPHSLSLRKLYPGAKIVGMLAAVNFLEHPEKPSTGWVYGYLQAARTQVDFYITQNMRMAELARCIFRFVARVDMGERILVCPLSIVEEQRRALPLRETVRAEMGLKDGELAFINSGGPWSWTDYDTFLQAFCNVVRGGVSSVKFYLMGFKQPENPDHDEMIGRIKAIITANKDLIGKNLMIYEDWYDASEKVFRFTCAADIGVNVSKDTAENWQSYRVRFLDYMKAGIPVIHTTGDYLSAHEGKDAVYPVAAGDISSYEAAIRLAATDAALRSKKAAGMKACAQAFDSRNTYGRLIDKLLSLPARNFKNPREVFDPPLLAPPLPQPSVWTSTAAASAGSNIWEDKAGWRDGEGPVKHDIPALKGQSLMRFGFDLTITDEITASWAEVIQIGAAPDKSRLTLCAVRANETAYRLVLRIFEESGKSFSFVSNDLPAGKKITWGFAITPDSGSVMVTLDGQSFTAEKLPPWKWIETGTLWLGSRRLPGILENIWLG